MGLSRQEYWSGLPFPSPGDLPDLLNLLRLVLWPDTWSVLENIPCALENIYSAALGCSVVYLFVRSVLPVSVIQVQCFLIDFLFILCFVWKFIKNLKSCVVGVQ